MSFFFVSHIIISAVVAFGTYLLFGFDASLSMLAGSALFFVNIVLLHFAWKRILQKKRFALSVGVIVIKYAILGFIIYKVATRPVLSMGWFCVGIGIIIFSTLAAAINESRKSNREFELLQDEKGNELEKLEPVENLKSSSDENKK